MKIKVKAYYEFAEPFKHTNYDGCNVGEEDGIKTIMFDDIEDMIQFALNNEFNLYHIDTKIFLINGEEGEENIFGSVEMVCD